MSVLNDVSEYKRTVLTSRTLKRRKRRAPMLPRWRGAVLLLAERS